MTELQGAFTINTRLFLTNEQRARLERLVREERIELADLVSTIVADHINNLAGAGSLQVYGNVVVPTRVFLSAEAREQIDLVAHEQSLDIADIMSWIVAGYVDTLPEAPPTAASAQADTAVLLRQRRAELNRLRMRRDRSGGAPAWLNAYIAELEADIGRMEQQ